MNVQFEHQTVLLREAVELLAPRSGGIYVDGTMGGGGHTRALLAACAPKGHVIGIDQDQKALDYAQQWGAAYGERLRLRKGNFRHLAEHLQQLGLEHIDGMLCDLGVSSPQLDEGDRGFSYQHDAPLDMRMDKQIKETAGDLVNSLDAPQLTRIFRDYGEEKWAARVAQKIVLARQERSIQTTGDLVEIIKAAIPAAARRTGPHPAKRIFQALRIAVNDELGALEELLKHVVEHLAPGGRIAIISFHSLEDRIVKQFFLHEAKDCLCPPHTPKCVCQHQARLRVITRKPVIPGAEEVVGNPRARSAKLRVAERL